MIKVIFTPLFVGLLSLMMVHVVLFSQWRQLAFRARISLVLGLSVTSGIFLLSMPAAATFLTRSLEFPYCDGAVQLPKDIPVAVVLSGGLIKGATPEKDMLVRESVMRVKKGAELFKARKMGLLVISGRSSSGPKEREGELMRELAVQMGVPGARIVLEVESTNTREHAIKLSKFSYINPNAPIAIVTSPWHLARTIQEFARFFPNAMPVPAYCSGVDGLPFWQVWLPNTGSLGKSTSILHEYMGRAWYVLRHGIGAAIS